MFRQMRTADQFLIIVFILVLNMPIQIIAQTPGAVELDTRVGVSIPFGPKITDIDQQLYSISAAADISAGYRFSSIPRLSIFGDIGYIGLPSNTSTSLSAISLSAGAGYLQPFSSRFFLEGNGALGMYLAISDLGTEFNPMVGARVAAIYQLSRTVSVQLGGQYQYFLTKSGGEMTAFYHGLQAFAGARFAFGGRRVSLVEWGEAEMEEVFPVQYSRYADIPFGSIPIINTEKSPIRDVVVSIIVPEFMSSPAVCLRVGEIAAGDTVEVPLKARFESSILGVTEARWADGLISVAYTYLDETITSEERVSLRILDRNSMRWDDDQKAAAFVSAKDPAVQRFATTVAGIARSSKLKPMHLNFGIALGMFEALKLQGTAYVIDPTTPYVETSEDVGAVDYLQFPHQTLQNLGGDCDDLSILYCALLEAVGVEAAFITIPGHIFAALNTGLSYDEALKIFRNPEELIRWEEDAWLPIEVTMVRDGFLQAWQKGANQWLQYSERFEAGFIPIQEAWKTYEPVGVGISDAPGEVTDREQLKRIYEREISRFLSRELEPQISEIESRIRDSGGSPREINRLGTLYARYGLFEEALEQFLTASEGPSRYLPSVVNAGNVYLIRGDYRRAVESFNRALEASPRSVSALAGLAQAQFGAEEFAEANRAIEMVRALRPELAERLDATYGSGTGTRAGIVDPETLWED